jgi:hypothetical protein
MSSRRFPELWPVDEFTLLEAEINLYSFSQNATCGLKD